MKPYLHSLFKKAQKQITDYHLGLILINAAVLLRMHYKRTVNDGVKGKYGVHGINESNESKNGFYCIIDFRVHTFT